MKRPYLIPMVLLCCAGIAYATGSITVTGYPAVPRTLKGGPGISIGADGTFTATGDAVVTGTQPFENLSSALRGKYLDKTGTATNASAYKGNGAPSGTEFSYLQGVTSAIQGQLDGKAASSSIALVGTTGQYGDLSGKPTIPSTLSELSGDATHRTVTDAQTTGWDGKQAALGFTPENAANKGNANGYPSLDSGGKVPTGQIPTLNQNTTGTAAGLTAQYIDWSLTSGGASIKGRPTLSTVATSGNYSDLNGKPSPYTLPTASTITKGGVLIDGSSIQIDGAGVIHSTVSAGVSSVNGYTGDIDLQTTDIVGFGNYSSSIKSRLAAKMDNVNPTFTGDLTTSNPDGTHYSWDYNTTACPTTNVPEGAKCTLPSGVWWRKDGAWTQTGMLPAYTLTPATASVIGGVKPGTALSVDSNGVISVMLNSLGPSGLVTAGLAGDQTISSGFAYVATSTPWKATFNSYTSTKQTTVFASYSGTVCAASGSKLYWPNPVTFANNSGACAKLRTGTRVTVQMLGGKTYATATQNLQKASIPMASVSPTTLAFGNIVAGNTSSPLTATLTNSGLANLVTGAPTISGTDAAKFAISANGCNAATVTAGSTCTESVTFTPGTAGSYSAQINIPHNAAGSPTVVALTGTGTVQAVLAITDSFARANQNPLRNGDNASETPTGTWASVAAMGGDAYIYNAALLKVGGYTSLMYWAHDTFAANQYASATVTAVTAGPAVRINTTTGDRYYLAIGSSFVTLNRYSGGTTTALQTYTVAVNTTKVYRLEASGSTLTVKVDGVAQSPTVTDSTLTSGQAGIYFGVNSQIGNFAAGNL